MPVLRLHITSYWVFDAAMAFCPIPCIILTLDKAHALENQRDSPLFFAESPLSCSSPHLSFMID